MSHASCLVSAGLQATLTRLPQCRVEVWDDASGPWHSSPSLAEVDLVVADAESFTPASSAAAEGATAAPPAPRVVLIATREASMPIELPRGADAWLPVGCREEDLFGTVHRLTGATVPQSPPRQRPRGGLAPGALRRVRKHVEERLAERIELRDLAAIAQLSECHFSRAFKQSMGLPPHRYVIARRIASAARMIEESDRPLADVALAAGFSDQSHFTRVFVDVMGETPRAFRHRHR
ncbi:helix-turn-helix domain-containing protein [Variovorax sp. YR216]|uniref:helix-turn-helix domain-containing protein n=1 Tax=Variovorax sp. YR216 TaxID=1882828 RepID=UPI00115FB5BB|nr:AraC family transcriptional regulator [Variovorax sp. YR216]